MIRNRRISTPEMFPRVIISVLLFSLFSPSSATSPLENKAVQCAVCQFIGASTSAKTGSDRAAAISHCHRFAECSTPLTDCQIVATLHGELESFHEKFESLRPAVNSAHEKCGVDSKALVISEDPSSTQCMLCFLVYDSLKYINYNILLNPMLADVPPAIGAACVLINDDICQLLLGTDSLNAIIRGLQDSLGSFYDLIAVQGFQCPALSDLFGQC